MGMEANLVLSASFASVFRAKNWFTPRDTILATCPTRWARTSQLLRSISQKPDGVTLATTTIDFASREDRDAALSTGMTDGMEMSYDQLDDVLA